MDFPYKNYYHLNIMKTIDIQDIKWIKKSGYGTAEQLFGTWRIPSSFQVHSPKSNITKTFVVDENAPGYEDGWDGEMSKFVSDCGDIHVTITHE